MNVIEILEHKNSLLEKCILLRRKFRLERTDESLQPLKDAENERHRFIISITKKQKRKEQRSGTKNKVK